MVVATTVLNRFKHRRDFGFRVVTNYSGDAAHALVSGFRSQVSGFYRQDAKKRQGRQKRSGG